MAGALTTGTEAHPDYDAAMRLVELSANPKERKEKLGELKAAQLALDDQQADLDETRAELRTESADLTKRETTVDAEEKGNAELAQTLSDRKVALDQETSDRRALDETTRSRLTAAAKAHDSREERLNALAHTAAQDTKSAKKLMVKAQGMKSKYDGMVAALRDIILEGPKP